MRWAPPYAVEALESDAFFGRLRAATARFPTCSTDRSSNSNSTAMVAGMTSSALAAEAGIGGCAFTYFSSRVADYNPVLLDDLAPLGPLADPAHYTYGVANRAGDNSGAADADDGDLYGDGDDSIYDGDTDPEDFQVVSRGHFSRHD